MVMLLLLLLLYFEVYCMIDDNVNDDDNVGVDDVDLF